MVSIAIYGYLELSIGIYRYLELSIDGRYIKLVTAIDNTIVKIEVPTFLDGGSEILHHQTDG